MWARPTPPLRAFRAGRGTVCANEEGAMPYTGGRADGINRRALKLTHTLGASCLAYLDIARMPTTTTAPIRPPRTPAGRFRYAPSKPMTIPAMIPMPIPVRICRCMLLVAIGTPRWGGGVERQGPTPPTLPVKLAPATPESQTLRARDGPDLRSLDPDVPLGVAHGHVQVPVHAESNELAALGKLHAIGHLTLLIDDEVDRAGVTDGARSANPEVAFEIAARGTGRKRWTIV